MANEFTIKKKETVLETIVRVLRRGHQLTTRQIAELTGQRMPTTIKYLIKHSEPYNNHPKLFNCVQPGGSSKCGVWELAKQE